MTETVDQIENLPRRGGDHRVFWWTCGIGLLFVPLVLFLPWDAPMPETPDLDYTHPAIPEAENAYTYFKAAGELTAAKFYTADGTPWDMALLGQPGSQFEAWDPKLADEILVANAAAFAELDKGLACRRHASPERKDFNDKGDFAWLSRSRQLCRVLKLKAKRARLAGDYPGALQAGLVSWQFGQVISNHNRTALEWVVGISLQRTAMSGLEDLAADPQTPKPVLREMQAALNQWSRKKFLEGYRLGLKSDYSIEKRSVGLDTYKGHALASGFGMNEPYYPKVEDVLQHVPYAFKPKIKLQLQLPLLRTLLETADKPFAEASRYVSEKMLTEPGDDVMKALFYIQPNSLGKRSSFLGQQVFFSSFVKQYEQRAYVAALRLRTALRLYEMKHGKLPDRLEALVPDYLQEIPADPYDGQPFRYSKSERKVWAIGSDLKDQGGSMRDSQDIMVDRPGGYDLVMPLDVREMKPPLAGPKTPDKEQGTNQP